MIQAYFVYTSLLVLMFCLSYISFQQGKYNNTILSIAILCFSVVIGCRYNVGTDYSSYLYLFQEPTMYTEDLPELNRIELAYKHLIIILSRFDFHYCILFIISAAIPLFLISSFYKINTRKNILPWFIVSFFSFALPDSLNIIRHFIAFSFFVYSFRYLEERNFLKFLLIIFVGSLFHKSLLTVFPIYFIATSSLFDNKKLIICLIVLLNLFGTNITDFILANLSSLIEILGYGGYLDSLNDYTELSRGFGLLGITLINIVSVFYSDKMKLYYGRKFLVVYNISVLGMILTPIFSSNIIVGRMGFYFSCMRVILTPYTLYFLLTASKVNGINKIIFLCILSFLLMLFYENISASSSQMSPFYFFWD